MPTLDERLADEYPGEFEIAQTWSAWLGELESAEPFYARVGAEHLVDRETPAVLGVGLSPPSRHEGVAPVVLVRIAAPTIVQLRGTDDFLFAGPHPLDDHVLANVTGDLARAHSAIAAAVEIRPTLLNVIGQPPAQEQAGPGDAAHCGKLATLGAKVKTAGGARGILTAGHAATQGAVVFDAKASPIGRVDESVSCWTAGSPRQPTPDVATIEMTVPDSLGKAIPFSRQATAAIWDNVTAYGALTQGKSSALLCAGITFAGPTPAQASYGNVMQTAYPISQPGDSGAPVLNQDDEIVGHVVAGYRGVYSIVQDVTYQLQAFGATLR